jgi:nitrite reductase/ring-hydroxylating ferredoxin subunit
MTTSDGTAPFTDLRDQALEVVKVDGRDYFRVRLEHRKVLVAAKCPHNGTPMSEAYVAGEFLVCRRHGATFDLRTGGWVRGPQCGNLTIRAVDEE